MKSMMENFQQQHKHPLPEEHRRMVPTVDMDAMLSVRRPMQLQENMLSFVRLVAIADFLDWNGERCWHPGDDEKMLGGKSICAVSSHSCGRLASLQLCSEPRTQQVMRYADDEVVSTTLDRLVYQCVFFHFHILTSAVR